MLVLLGESLLDLRFRFLPKDENGLESGESRLVPRGRNAGGALGGVSEPTFRFCKMLQRINTLKSIDILQYINTT